MKQMKRFAALLILVIGTTLGWAQTSNKVQRVEVAPGTSIMKKVYEMTEPGIVMPKFPGGEAGLMNYLRNTIKYPIEAERQGIEGRVICAFTVAEDGAVTDFEIKKSVDRLLDDETERVVRNMPKWTPGSKDGWNISVHYVLPVSFKLNKNKANTDSIKAKNAQQQVFDADQIGMPSFPGGVNALLAYLTNNVKYPRQAEKKNIQGRVICQYIVEADGSISNVSVLKGIHPLCDAEAVRVIQNMPKWNPGIENGKKVRVKYTLPITFKLK